MKFIHNGDCLEQMRCMKENSVDAVVTDPPYELGFMGKKWDNTGIANNKAMWAEALRVLKPGGHLLSFSGTRTYHRMACAIEDAGFEVRDMIEWVYGSGFPKSLNIGKAVDKLQGNEREVVGKDKSGSERNCMAGDFTGGEYDLTKGTSEYEGWGTALKPAHEPICMARKPLSEKTVAENCLKWGTGGINIDASRVGTGDRRMCGTTDKSGETSYVLGAREETRTELGRFPANLIHDNSEEVRACFPEANGGKARTGKKGGSGFGFFDDEKTKNTEGTWHGGSGNASRFFKSIIYQAKASKSERNKGCEGLEEKFAPKGTNDGRDMDNPKNHLGGMQSSKARNHHPTVKPIALMEYLIKMVTTKGGTVLDPFMGSGSTGVACMQTGRAFIGIEMDAEYCLIAEKRINESFEKKTGEEDEIYS